MLAPGDPDLDAVVRGQPGEHLDRPLPPVAAPLCRARELLHPAEGVAAVAGELLERRQELRVGVAAEPVRARPAGDVVPGRLVRRRPPLRPAGRSASPRPAGPA